MTILCQKLLRRRLSGKNVHIHIHIHIHIHADGFLYPTPQIPVSKPPCPFFFSMSLLSPISPG